MFLTDSQTISDLALFTRDGSVYELYNQTLTSGGAQVLEEFFRYPMDNIDSINDRLALMEAFGAGSWSFPFDRAGLDVIEGYLSERGDHVDLPQPPQGLKQKVAGWVTGEAANSNMLKGISSLFDLLWELDHFIQGKERLDCRAFDRKREDCMQLLHEGTFAMVFSLGRDAKLSHQQYAALDQAFRLRGHQQIKKILRHVYEMDVFFSISRLAKEKQLTFARPVPDTAAKNGLVVKALRHPLVENAIGNDLYMDSAHNLVFLTGANMAGKSTLMKSIALAVYLAHLGMPVAAGQMEFTVMDGIYSTINLPDNLGMGASHFYAEVLRVKKVAKELRQGKRLFVLFDELFRGTNVKDAAEATVAVLEGFARQRSSLFIISTHIMEAAEALSRSTRQVRYYYMPTVMQQAGPVYTYKLQEGVTEDRHGMVIIKNEGILQMLMEGLQPTIS